jgi:aromatic ring-opening dioxygenase catalytic subunit (LigB family)
MTIPTMTTSTLPTLFVPHGGGPCFFMDWDPPDAWDRMGAWLRGVPELVGARPKAVVVISAHWEEDAFTVNAQTAPPLLFDYFGFPAHTYRGLDHSVFIPFKLIYPDADIPIVQLSLRTGLDPAEHIAAGRALAPLRREDVLIVGTGMSYHNMRGFRFSGTGANPDSQRFDAWLAEAVAAPDREQRLCAWAQAPGGRASHPREEHLIPLHVVAGAASDEPGRRVFQDQVLGSAQSAFMFGE